MFLFFLFCLFALLIDFSDILHLFLITAKGIKFWINFVVFHLIIFNIKEQTFERGVLIVKLFYLSEEIINMLTYQKCLSISFDWVHGIKYS